MAVLRKDNRGQNADDGAHKPQKDAGRSGSTADTPDQSSVAADNSAPVTSPSSNQTTESAIYPDVPTTDSSGLCVHATHDPVINGDILASDVPIMDSSALSVHATHYPVLSGDILAQLSKSAPTTAKPVELSAGPVVMSPPTGGSTANCAAPLSISDVESVDVEMGISTDVSPRDPDHCSLDEQQRRVSKTSEGTVDTSSSHNVTCSAATTFAKVDDISGDTETCGDTEGSSKMGIDADNSIVAKSNLLQSDHLNGPTNKPTQTPDTPSSMGDNVVGDDVVVVQSLSSGTKTPLAASKNTEKPASETSTMQNPVLRQAVRQTTPYSEPKSEDIASALSTKRELQSTTHLNLESAQDPASRRKHACLEIDKAVQYTILSVYVGNMTISGYQGAVYGTLPRRSYPPYEQDCSRPPPRSFMVGPIPTGPKSSSAKPAISGSRFTDRPLRPALPTFLQDITTDYDPQAALMRQYSGGNFDKPLTTTPKSSKANEECKQGSPPSEDEVTKANQLKTRNRAQPPIFFDGAHPVGTEAAGAKIHTLHESQAQEAPVHDVTSPLSYRPTSPSFTSSSQPTSLPQSPDKKLKKDGKDHARNINEVADVPKTEYAATTLVSFPSPSLPPSPQMKCRRPETSLIGCKKDTKDSSTALREPNAEGPAAIPSPSSTILSPPPIDPRDLSSNISDTGKDPSNCENQSAGTNSSMKPPGASNPPSKSGKLSSDAESKVPASSPQDQAPNEHEPRSSAKSSCLPSPQNSNGSSAFNLPKTTSPTEQRESRSLPSEVQGDAGSPSRSTVHHTDAQPKSSPPSTQNKSPTKQDPTSNMSKAKVAPSSTTEHRPAVTTVEPQGPMNSPSSPSEDISRSKHSVEPDVTSKHQSNAVRKPLTTPHATESPSGGEHLTPDVKSSPQNPAVAVTKSPPTQLQPSQTSNKRRSWSVSAVSSKKDSSPRPGRRASSSSTAVLFRIRVGPEINSDSDSAPIVRPSQKLVAEGSEGSSSATRAHRDPATTTGPQETPLPASPSPDAPKTPVKRIEDLPSRVRVPSTPETLCQSPTSPKSAPTARSNAHTPSTPIKIRDQDLSDLYARFREQPPTNEELSAIYGNPDRYPDPCGINLDIQESNSWETKMVYMLRQSRKAEKAVTSPD